MIKAWAPVLVQLIVTIGAIIMAIISNRKKTQESIKETNDKVDALDKKLSGHIKENEDDNAKQIRARILNFYDEICEKKKHSESHYDDILDDIDEYERYVVAHPDFKNNRGEVAMSYIREVYHVQKETGGFLTHN